MDGRWLTEMIVLSAHGDGTRDKRFLQGCGALSGLSCAWWAGGIRQDSNADQV